jgi:hypothetical protein
VRTMVFEGADNWRARWGLLQECLVALARLTERLFFCYAVGTASLCPLNPKPYAVMLGSCEGAQKSQLQS